MDKEKIIEIIVKNIIEDKEIAHAIIDLIAHNIMCRKEIASEIKSLLPSPCRHS